MAILFVGGEDIDFPNGSVTFSTSAARSGYSRGGMQSAGARSYNFVGGAVTSAWLSQRVYFANGWTNPGRWAGLCKDATSTAGLYLANDYGRLQLVKWSGSAATVLDFKDGVTAAGTPVRADMQVVDYGAAATVRVYVNGALEIEYTGDVAQAGVTSLGAVGLYSPYYGYVSEVIVADEDTRLLNLVTLAPNAAGDINEWSGDYTAIDETTLSDADAISTDVGEKSFAANLTALPTGDFIVKHVEMAYRAADGVGGMGVQGGIRTNGAYYLGTQRTLNSSWQVFREQWATNPATSNRFTLAEINALQIAFLSKAI